MSADQGKNRKAQTVLYPLTLKQIAGIAHDNPRCKLWFEQRGCKGLVRVNLADHYMHGEAGWAFKVNGIAHEGKEYRMKWRLWDGKPDKATRAQIPWNA